MKTLPLVLLLLLLLCACGVDPVGPATPPVDPVLAALFPATLPAAPADLTNHLADDPTAARFGQQLFFDPGFSGRLLDGDNDGTPSTLGTKGQTGRVACAGCHVPEDAFTDTRTLGKQVSLAAGWGLRRTPTLLDIAQAPLLHSDGSHPTLFDQILAPLESPVEMNTSRLFVAHQLKARYAAEYTALFGAFPDLDDAARFPPLSAQDAGCHPTTVDPLPAAPCNGPTRGVPGDGAELDGMNPADVDAITQVVRNAGKAIAAYERLLTCGPSRVDAWVYGDSEALTDAEVRGLTLFTGKAACAACHSGPFLTDQKFHNVGLAPQLVAEVFIDRDDPGANGVAGPLGAFRTPSLRCVGMRPSFMHTGHMRTLRQVVGFFNRGGDHAGFLGVSEIAPLGLTPEEVDDLVAFLEALTGPGPDPSLLEPPQ